MAFILQGRNWWDFPDINGCRKGSCVDDTERSEGVLWSGCKTSPFPLGALSAEGCCLSAPQHCLYCEDPGLCGRQWCQHGLCWAMNFSPQHNYHPQETPILGSSWNTQNSLCAQSVPHIPCTLFSTVPSKWKLFSCIHSLDVNGCQRVLKTLSTYIANDN